MITYHRWSNVPDNLKTKTKWDKAGRRLKPDSEPVACYKNMGKSYELWAMESTIEKDQNRVTASLKAVKTKATALMDQFERIPIQVKIMPIDELKKSAIDSYNINKQYSAYNQDYVSASEDSDSAFLERIMVNFLRHNCTTYDEYLGHLKGKVGKNDAYEAYKNRVLDEISESYPDLESECERQKVREW